MKISLPLKLGIAVVLLFALVIATCLLWTPMKVRYYTAKLKSDDAKEKLRGAEGLIDSGKRGKEILVKLFPDGKEAAEYVIQHWNNVNAPLPDNMVGCSVLHFAVLKGWKDVVLLLLEKGADVNMTSKSNRRPLHLSVEGNNTEIAAMLASYGADLNAKMGIGITSLHLATARNNAEIVVLLAELGADVNSKDNYGLTPLAYAVRRDHVKMMHLLIEKRARTNVVNVYDNSLLHIAVEYKSIKAAKLLIESGFDINVKGSGGETPLHHVAKRCLDTSVMGRGPAPKEGMTITYARRIDKRAKEVALFLLKNGADVNATDRRGFTPLDVSGMIEMKDFLRSHGALTGEEIREQGNKETRE